MSYVYEGDNFNDAELFANKLAQILNLGTNITWVRPVSWLGVYGDKPVANATEDGLYGWFMNSVGLRHWACSHEHVFIEHVFIDGFIEHVFIEHGFMKRYGR